MVFFPKNAASQEHNPGFNYEVIRGEVWVELEPIYGDRIENEYPLNIETAARRALQEAALYFSGMIYGWFFHYEIGERARGIAEDFYIFEPMGEVRWGDPKMIVTESEKNDTKLRIWADYRMNEAQQKRILQWHTGTVKNAQAYGYSPLWGPEPDSSWLEIRNAVLKDAARSAVRGMLRSSERNRPKEVSGYISLASFPRFYVDKGLWAASVRFHVQINEIIPFAAY